MSRPLNYTTKIPASRTVAECQDLLAQAGAESVSVLYENRRPSGLSFRIETPFGMRSYAMPVNSEGTAQLLRKMDEDRAWPPSFYKGGAGTKLIRQYLTPEHAAAVAWRVARDWLEAQLAVIAISMVSLDQVMLPYLEVDPGVTVYDRYLANERAALEAGSTR
jgi:hypothetical protein